MSSSFDRRVHNSFQTVDITVSGGVTQVAIPLNNGLSVPPLSDALQETPWPHMIRLTVPSAGATHTVLLPPVSTVMNASLSQIRIAIAISFLTGSGGSSVSISTTSPDEFFCFGPTVAFIAPEDDDGCVCVVVQSPPPNSPAPFNTQWTVVSSYEI